MSETDITPKKSSRPNYREKLLNCISDAMGRDVAVDGNTLAFSQGDKSGKNGKGVSATVDGAFDPHHLQVKVSYFNEGVFGGDSAVGTVTADIQQDGKVVVKEATNVTYAGGFHLIGTEAPQMQGAARLAQKEASQIVGKVQACMTSKRVGPGGP